MGRKSKYTLEARKGAVRRVLTTEREHPSQWAAIQSVAEELGCTAETLRKWVREEERQLDEGSEPTTAARLRVENRERRLHELARANAVLRRVSAMLAGTEVDRPLE